LVDLAREISNCTFLDLQLLCERLEELDLEAIMAGYPITDEIVDRVLRKMAN